MSAVASIKFAQGSNIGVAGQAFIGDTTSGDVTITNGSNTSVASWQIDILYVPPGSSVPVSTPYVFNNSSSTPSATFTPDLSGSYRIQLTVWESVNRTGNFNVDIRVFGVLETTHGFLRPPAQIWPKPLPPIQSGLPTAKANELNFNDQPNGWSGTPGDGLMDDVIRRLDASSFDVVPFPSAGNDRDLLQVVNIHLVSAIVASFAAGSYWISSNDEADLVEVDNSQFEILSHTMGTVTVPSGNIWVDAKAQGNNIWLWEITTSLDGYLRVFDAGTRSFSEATFIATPMPSRPEITFDGSGRIWTYDFSHIVRVNDPLAGNVSLLTPTASSFPKSIDYDAVNSAAIWVASTTTDGLSIKVDKVDPDGVTVLGTFSVTTPFGANQIQNLCVAAGQTAIWVMASSSDATQTFLYKVNPTTAAIVGSALNLSSTFTFMGLDIAVNTTDGDKVYVLGNSGASGENSRIAKIDGATNTVDLVTDLDTLSILGGFLNQRLSSLNSFLVIPYNTIGALPAGDGQVFFVDATTLSISASPNPVVSELVYRASREGAPSPVPVSAVQGGYGSYVAQSTDYLIPVDVTGSPFEVILPSAPIGTRFEVHDVNGFASFNPITVATVGNDTIQGTTTYVINTNYGTITLTKITHTVWSVS